MPLRAHLLPMQQLLARPGERNGRRPRLTLFGRSVLLLASELAVNAVCWVIAGILFGRKRSTQPILSLALLAWTIGLRHGMYSCLSRLLIRTVYDVQLYSTGRRSHKVFFACQVKLICQSSAELRYPSSPCPDSAIDNATRSLISLGQLPVTCGLFFSLGHSTIVIVVNVAIAISTSVYHHIDGVGQVGGIVGAAVSGSFLFIVGLANSIIIWKVLTKRGRVKKDLALRIERGEDPADIEDGFEEEESRGNTLTMRLIGPIISFVDKPWKMYPVGVLFGFGFDTASSIALLAVSAIAKKDSDGNQIPASDVVILPLLFTAGMTMVDSIDSILMLYSYSGFPERGFALFDRKVSVGPEIPQNVNDNALVTQAPPASVDSPVPAALHPAKTLSSITSIEELPARPHPNVAPESSSELMKLPARDEESITNVVIKPVEDEETRRLRRVKRNAMSGLSILLTLMSIIVAFSISLITIMGLIGDNCGPCQRAIKDPNGGGLAGRWWRGWARANDNSGYIGAAIVGSFVAVVGLRYGSRWAWRKILSRRLTI